MPFHPFNTQYLVIEKADGSMRGHDFRISENDTLGELIQGLRIKYKEESAVTARLFVRVVLLRRTTVEIARITSLSLGHLEAQNGPARVYVTARTRDDDLSEAFNGSGALGSTSLLVSSLDIFAFESISAKRAALLIGLEFDKALCCYLLVGTMILSFVLGLAVALVSRRLDLALATVATVAAWVACFEGLFLWMYR